MTIKVRFAPSPTGYLHVGNCRTALINWLFAQNMGGTFLLRLDDTDVARGKPEYVKRIYEDLAWLGITIDEEVQQSMRLKRYATQAAYLKSTGRLYPCYETSEELAFKRKKQLAQGKPPLYDREGLNLSAEDVKRFEAEGRIPHWRFKLDNAAIKWHDLVRGDVHFEGTNLSDPVLVREDNSPLYTLASVIDDMDMGVTHIIRGEDHVANTAIQVQLIEALGGNSVDFSFAHLPLVADEKGDGLSKRLGSLSVSELKEMGILPQSLCALLARLGTSDPVMPFTSMTPLIHSFSFEKFARATPKFSWTELETLNAKVLHEIPFEAIASYLPAGLPITPAFWQNVQTNLSNIQDIVTWWTICCGDVTVILAPEDKGFILEAYTHLKENLDMNIAQWFEAFKTSSDRKGKNFFMPLRLALTGESHGPELPKILSLMGSDKTLERFDLALTT